MNNFWTLYRYELKKLLKRRLAWIIVFTLAAFIAYTAWPMKASGGAAFSLTDRAGDTVSRYITVAEQRNLRREGARRISGQVMDKTFFQKVREVSSGNGQYDIPGLWDMDCYFYLIDSSYYEPFSMVQSGIGLDPAKITAEQFYQVRQRLIETQWAELSDSEVAYWQTMEAQVEKPFVYRYSDGYQKILSDVFGLSNVIPLMAAVCLCGVFSEERRTRADVLIFSSRRGRFPQYLAKVMAGMTVVFTASLFIIGVDVVIVLLTQGGEGFDAALQLWNLTSSFPVTIGQAVLIMGGLLLLYSLLSGGITMLLSVLTQNTIAAMAGPILLMIVQAWLKLDAQAAEYLPNQLFNTIPTLRNFHLVNFFGIYLSNLQFCFIAYGILTVILMVLCWLGWRRSAAGRA